jgi:hypothetical protein
LLGAVPVSSELTLMHIDAAEALGYITTGAWNGKALPSYGDLHLATEREREALFAMQALVDGYLEEPAPRHPFCIAVFGPPGSGKTVSVKKIFQALKARRSSRASPLVWFKLNLTQFSTTLELAQELAEIGEQTKGDRSIPMVFFDEFDTPLNGTPLGWLPWFLAPMEDGEFLHRGKLVSLPRAVFVFAGGTAHRSADFGERNPDRFRDSKGPDFTSRLRGFLDVFGPNDGDLGERCRRRALSIRHQLAQELKASAEPALLEAMLHAGRYRHGNRSLSAVLELCSRARDNAASTRELRVDDLPPDHLLSLHVDHGPLDAARIGGAVGMSCNFDNAASGEAMREVARELWRQGALLAYFRGHQVNDAFPWHPTTEATQQPNALSKHAYQALRAELFVLGDVDLSKHSPSDPGDTVTVVRVPGRGRTGWRANPKLAFEELMRVRWVMNSRCVARVLAEGRTEPSRGRRVPGIYQEAMLALVSGQPIYVLGGFGGAAQCLGGLLGLATHLRDLPELKLRSSRLPPHWAPPGGACKLPEHGRDIPPFLTSFAIGCRAWPDNGLRVDENRELFESKNAAQICDLVRKGLLRRFGP